MAKRFVCTLEEPVVTTAAGKLRGYKLDDIYHFEGIRYASMLSIGNQSINKTASTKIPGIISF